MMKPKYQLTLMLVILFSPALAHADCSSQGGSQDGGAFDVSVINWAICELCGHITGHLGGLLTVVAGVGALTAAAMGSFRAFMGALITAVGGFSVVTIMSFYFPDAAEVCAQGGLGDSAIPEGNTGNQNPGGDRPPPPPAPQNPATPEDSLEPIWRTPENLP